MSQCSQTSFNLFIDPCTVNVSMICTDFVCLCSKTSHFSTHPVCPSVIFVFIPFIHRLSRNTSELSLKPTEKEKVRTTHSMYMHAVNLLRHPKMKELLQNDYLGSLGRVGGGAETRESRHCRQGCLSGSWVFELHEKQEHCVLYSTIRIYHFFLLWSRLCTIFMQYLLSFWSWKQFFHLPAKVEDLSLSFTVHCVLTCPDPW